MKQDMIVILDLGSHENTVLARAIRALGVYSEIYPHDITMEELKALPNVKGIIINGGPNNVIDGVAIDVDPAIYTMGIPVMAAGHDKATCAVKLPAFTDDIEAIKAAVKSFDFGVVWTEIGKISRLSKVDLDGSIFVVKIDLFQHSGFFYQTFQFLEQVFLKGCTKICVIDI